MKKLTIIICNMFFISSVFAQTANWEWAKSAGGADQDIGYSVAVDTFGNVYEAGYFFSPTITFGSTVFTKIGTGIYDGDIYLAKYDQNGNLLWVKSAGGKGDDRAYSVSVDVSGNVYLTGSFVSDSIFFDSTFLMNVGVCTIFLTKYDTDGNVIWAKRAGDIGGVNENHIKTDSSGNIYMTGYFGTPTLTFGSTTLINHGICDIFLAKYDTDGNVLWAKSAGGTYQDVAYSVAVDAMGDIYLTGYFDSDSISFDTITFAYSGTGNFFLCKYDSDGNVLWAKSASGWNSGQSVATNLSGDVYMSGIFLNSITFGSTTLTNGNIFLVKYDYNGNELWAKSAWCENQTWLNIIALDNSGNLYMEGGFLSDTARFDSTILLNVGSLDFYLAKYDSNGNFLWARSTGSVSSDDARSIAVNSNGDIYVTGVYGPGLVFGSTTLAAVGSSDVFLAKFSQIPIADFSPANLSICQNTCIDFVDLSSVQIDSWDWSFPGSSVPSSNIQNPSNICYPNTGTFNITLIVTNAYGSDTLTRNIIVSSAQPIVYATAAYDTICLGYCTDISASGAFTYTWIPGNYIASTVNVCPITSTMYTVTGFAVNGCSDKDSVFVFVDPCLGVDNFYNTSCDFNIFPNPSTDKIEVRSEQSELRSVTIYNMQGLLLRSFAVNTKATTIDISGFAKGIYIVKLQTVNGLVNKKLIIQ